MKYFMSLLLCFSIAFSALPEKNPAPTFFLRTLDDKAFFLSDEIKKGQPIVLSFFATWCVPCRKEMPELQTLSEALTDVSFYLINVSNLNQDGTKLKEDPVKVREMVESLKVELPVLMDKYAMTAEKYEAFILPRLIVIDKKGIIVHSSYGYDKDKGLEEIEKILKDLDD